MVSQGHATTQQSFGRMCDRQTFVIVDANLGPEMVQYAKTIIQYWNRIVGWDLLVYGTQMDLTDIGDKPPFILIRRIPEHEMYDRDVKRIGGNATKFILRVNGPKVCIVGSSVYSRQIGDDIQYDSVHKNGDTTVYWGDDRVTKYTSERAYFTLMHELGHAIGLHLFHHSVDEHSLMYSKYRATERLGDDTLSDLHKLYGDKR